MSTKKLLQQSRRQSISLLHTVKGNVLKVYVNHGGVFAGDVAFLETTGTGAKYNLTKSSWRTLNQSLKESSGLLREDMKVVYEKSIKKTIEINAGSLNEYNRKFLVKFTDLDPDVLDKVYKQINSELFNMQYEKVFKDGLTVSKRIWKHSLKFEQDLRMAVEDGVKLGRSVETISKDINAYVRGGKKTIAKRYGNLDNSPIRAGESVEDWKRRVARFKSRLPQNIEYNSLRLVRTQIQGTIQKCNVAASDYTPSVRTFDWVLSPAHAVYSICDDIEAGNPWDPENFPYELPPHPNCMSTLKYNEIPDEQFKKDLRTWVKNPSDSSVGYMNDWYEKYYRPMLENTGTHIVSNLKKRCGQNPKVA